MELPRWVRDHAENVKQSDSVLLVTHHDADGVSSAGAIIRSLEAMGKEYEVVILRQFYPDTLEKLPISSYDYVLFTDLAGRYIDLIRSQTESFLVIDHHDNVALSSKNLFHPSQMGYDPDTEASSSTLSALFSYHLHQDLKTLVYGLVGAAGDMQIVNGSFTGLNRVIVIRGIRGGVLTLYRDLALPGIEARDLPWVLENSDPPLPGFAGNPEAVYSFLERLGFLAKSAYGRIYYRDLSLDEKRKLFTALAMHLMRYGWTTGDVKSLIGEVYEVNGNPLWTSRIRTFKTLSNALGKKMRTDIIVPLYLDDFSVLGEAVDVLEEYRREISRAIKVGRELMEDLGYLVLVDGRGKIPYYSSGTVASVLSLEVGKPVVVLVSDSGKVKGSVRGGRNLSSFVEELLSLVPGEGGGHSEAAGFRIDEDDVEKLIEALSSQKLQSLVEGPLLD